MTVLRKAIIGLSTVLAAFAIAATACDSGSARVPTKLELVVRNVEDGSLGKFEVTDIEVFEWRDGGALEVKGTFLYLDASSREGVWDSARGLGLRIEDQPFSNHQVYPADAVVEVKIVE